MNYLETFTNPYDKFNGVCHMRREIARSLDKYWENRPKPTKEKIRVTAENILPLFSYCMAASRNEKMRAHQVFIEEFIEEDLIKFGEEGYSFTTFVATVDFLVMYNDVSPRKSKLKINKDIVFVSYANLPITNYLEFPPLASVEQFPYEQAKKATEILFYLLEEQKNPEVIKNNFQNILLEGKLVIHKK